ncbi:MAG: hypothetical protein KC468_03010 [Myxococcales bacterium]|nr:hypothetical protein [Myxococcales bacterium]
MVLSPQARWGTAARSLVAAVLLCACASVQGEGWGAFELDATFRAAARAGVLDEGSERGAAARSPGERGAELGAADSADVPADAPVVQLIAFGDAGASTAAQRQVTEALARTLEQARAEVEGARRVIPVVLWLGNNFGEHALAPVPAGDTRARAVCISTQDAWSRPEAAALAKVVRAHRWAGFASFAVLGRRDWECGAPQLAFQEPGDDGPHPWVMPTYNYVVRVFPGGEARVASRCDAGPAITCALEPGGEAALVELVLLDTSPWNDPPFGERSEDRDAESLAQQRALLEAVRASAAERASAPLRLLVTHHPIETAGPHGQGGLYPDSAFMYTEPALQRLLDDGVFAGVISGHDRNLQVTADISDGVKRSSRYWLDYPVFQVVAGASSRPDGRAGAGARGLSWYKGQALIPDLISERAGFAELRVSADDVLALLHTRAGGRWRVGAVTIPRGRARHPVATASPGMEPCVGCDSRPPRPR